MTSLNCNLYCIFSRFLNCILFLFVYLILSVDWRRHSDLVFGSIKHHPRVSQLACASTTATARLRVILLFLFFLIHLSRAFVWLVGCRQLESFWRWHHLASSILCVCVSASADARLLLDAARRPGGACRRTVERGRHESRAPSSDTRARCVFLACVCADSLPCPFEGFLSF